MGQDVLLAKFQFAEAGASATPISCVSQDRGLKLRHLLR